MTFLLFMNALGFCTKSNEPSGVFEVAKIKMKTTETLAESFERFLLSKSAKGITEKTMQTYSQHFHAIGKHLDLNQETEKLSSATLCGMVESMRKSNLSPNSIKSYTITLKAFLSWCNVEGLTAVNMVKYKGEDTVKDTYTDTELIALLKKPNIRKCGFAEYRSWVIVNLLVNSGSRAATIRNIQNRDVDLSNQIIYARHTKNRKALTIPLCSELVGILREYSRTRGGEPSDYLFCNENGSQLTENGLRCSIASYNKRCSIQKTSIHLFRHTFARKYLIDCGGNAFTLQKLLGHSTLDMTKHYCAIFDADIAKNYDSFSPLAQMKASSTRIKMPAGR